eukprot:GEMP01013481.1.p1 GENE.GEMP01013481.1~~GEMP01013481.1.p1  ORF type:complete len:223 (-),score=-22.89 GEMP01013481.1:2202-2870(-)
MYSVFIFGTSFCLCVEVWGGARIAGNFCICFAPSYPTPPPTPMPPVLRQARLMGPRFFPLLFSQPRVFLLRADLNFMLRAKIWFSFKHNPMVASVCVCPGIYNPKTKLFFFFSRGFFICCSKKRGIIYITLYMYIYIYQFLRRFLVKTRQPSKCVVPNIHNFIFYPVPCPGILNCPSLFIIKINENNPTISPRPKISRVASYQKLVWPKFKLSFVGNLFCGK